MGNSDSNNAVIGTIKTNKEQNSCRAAMIGLFLQDFVRNVESELLHGVALFAEQCAFDLAPEGRIADVTGPRQLVQERHGGCECLAAPHKFGLVGIIREEGLAISDVLVDLILGITRKRFRAALDFVSKAEKIGNISGNNWNCEAMQH